MIYLDIPIYPKPSYLSHLIFLGNWESEQRDVIADLYYDPRAYTLVIMSPDYHFIRKNELFNAPTSRKQLYLMAFKKAWDKGLIDGGLLSQITIKKYLDAASEIIRRNA
jgi:hypothetical protein